MNTPLRTGARLDWGAYERFVWAIERLVSRVIAIPQPLRRITAGASAVWSRG
ncbi:MAG: hypothetical protein AAFV26_01100 [Pseudomonadota bacterium]